MKTLKTILLQINEELKDIEQKEVIHMGPVSIYRSKMDLLTPNYDFVSIEYDGIELVYKAFGDSVTIESIETDDYEKWGASLYDWSKKALFEIEDYLAAQEVTQEDIDEEIAGGN